MRMRGATIRKIMTWSQTLLRMIMKYTRRLVRNIRYMK